jgi:DNA-binding PadR family transcriptional regulator
MTAEPRPSPLALTILGLLVAGPLHPYAMQRLIKEWGKDEVINVGQRAGLYRTIKRLHKAGLVAVRHTERDENYPERTVYELTDEGRRILREWLLAMLGTPRNEFPEFPAALSFIMLLAPAEVLPALESRAASLRQSLEALGAALGGRYDPLPRLFLLETEYIRAVTASELGWVEGIAADLRSGRLSWSEEELLELAQSYQSYQQVMADAKPPL